MNGLRRVIQALIRREYSAGRLEGDTFVSGAGVYRKKRRSTIGQSRSTEMHVIQRFRRRDFGHLDMVHAAVHVQSGLGNRLSLPVRGPLRRWGAILRQRPIQPD